MNRHSAPPAFLLAFTLLPACAGLEPRAADDFDVILRGGTIYDGSGDEPHVGDIGLRGDRIAGVGDLGDARARREIDVAGLAVAPGFINMLSWATRVPAGRPAGARATSDQGVTLEIFGEGTSMGPLEPRR